MQQSKVLCFNLSGEEFKSLLKISDKLGAEPVCPAQSDFSQTVGALIGVFPKTNEICLSPFKEKMIIMSSFTKAKMEEFLDALRKEQIKIDYKAMVTPTNLSWKCSELVEELKKEHEQIRRMKNQ